MSRFVSLLALFVVLFATRAALADKVAVLRFRSTSGASTRQVDAAYEATRAAVLKVGHVLPTDSESLSAQMAVQDSVADSSTEYRAAGRASTSQWAVAGSVDPREAGYRVEIEACQVESGRVESLAREIEPTQADQQISEMLALLLRPQGIGKDIPWWTKPNPKPPEEPPKPPEPAPPPEPPPPPPTPAVKHAYAEGRPVVVGLEGGVTGALSRPGNAQGPSTSAFLGFAGGYAFDAIPGLEARGRFDFAIAGPKSVSFDVGARYAVPIAPTIRLFAGPELGLGAFFTLGGDQSARFLGRASPFVALGLGERVQLDLACDFSWLPGGSGTLVLAGARLGVGGRF
jgi:hypothetical protein